MAQKALSFFLLLLAATATVSSALNITSILEQYPDFSTFNTLLTQSGVAAEINSRSSITVLAADNKVLSGFQALDPKVIKIVLSVHVVLDYYDVPKIENIGEKSTILTTLFQTTGNAQDKQGFLNMSKTGGGKDQVVFGSTMPGSVSQANLVKSVVSKPYNLSVLQVDSLIVPSIVGAPTPAPAEHAADAPVPAANDAKAPSTSAKAPSTDAPATTATAPATTATAPATNEPTEAATVPAPAASKASSPATSAKAPSAGAPQADAPVSSADAKAPSSGAPEAGAPATDAPTANAPTADSPAAITADAPAPKGEVKAADAPKSGAGRVAAGAGVGVAIMGLILLGL